MLGRPSLLSGAAAVLMLIGLSREAFPAQSPSPDPTTACERLNTTDFQSIQDAPTQVTGAAVVAAAAATPAHCHVEGYISSNIRFALELPTSDWNGKLLEVAPGGQGGSIHTMELWCDDALRRGYACITNDTGHYSTTGDSLWAYNNLAALIDYSIRSTHVGAVAGKALLQAYYGRPARYAYFQGCSGGGQKALVEAQRFPWDFDGIISMDPATNLVGTTDITLLWNALVDQDREGHWLFSERDLRLLHNAALKQCNYDFGVRDGVVGDPMSCKFDPGVLACKKGQTANCLSAAKIVAARKIYSGPTASDGRRLFYGSMPGSEFGGFGFRALATYKENFFRYLAFWPPAGPGWKAKDFNFDEDYKREGVESAISAADNPDLSKLRSAGGKLMIIADLDSSGSPLPWASIGYYEMVEKLMGGRVETQKSVRLFALPGVAHCGSGPGANAFDFLGYMEAWVEHHRAPDMMIGAHVEGPLLDRAGRESADFIHLPRDLRSVSFTRPAYPYPLQARYSGYGNSKDYRNWSSVDPAGQSAKTRRH